MLYLVKKGFALGKGPAMNMRTVDQSSEAIAQRINAIIRELEELRNAVLRTYAEPPGENLVEQLYGALGQGDWGEYDLDLDWQRFAR